MEASYPMTRHEFGRPVKRAALERSGGQCEAIGLRYGLMPGLRCRASVSHWRVNYEHWPRGAHDPAPETVTLANCTAICEACNQWANHHHDTPREAKMKRVTEKRGRTALQVERSPKAAPKMRGNRQFQQGHRPMPSRPFRGRGKE